MLDEHAHDLGVELLGDGLDLGGPVEDLPVVGGQVDQTVVQAQLLGGEVLQIPGK